MGVALPALSTSSSEDIMNLGVKDSIRRRALWALEGKASSDGFSPAEIPELSAPEIERRISELRMITSIFHPLRSLADPTAQRARRRFLPLWIASLQVSAASLLCATQLDLFFPDPGLCPLQAYCLASPFCYHPSDSCLCIHVVFALRFGNREHVLNVLGPL
jgi:hypothetical protein